MSFYLHRGKRLADVVGALALAPAAAAVCAVAAVAIKLDDGGPVLYSSQRLGKDMKPFTLHKLRSMAVDAPDLRNADGSTYSSSDDPRVTRVGRILRRTSIDELPQLINVLKGEMSIIGPRPSPLGHEHTYTESFKRKFEVLPGITGYSQALNRNSDTLPERERTDTYYVDNVSLRLDLEVLLRTLVTVSTSRNLNRA
ncbi:sugar transferase [Micrococcus luteus]|uniref:sugar transferase n=1 Tax=Micrococcus TaxID=1269 RepID=UPI0011516730|nr:MULTISPECIES: sugar transferase [Micrococcus]MCV7498675.1 sugar transferase [Micrococcus luteus]MCV7597577.1 sugar transferase [Micrococcus luteus]TQF65516.1 sugar transferase [Micrococcus sp. R8502A1]UTT45064.1 sugar transferase [Micrococcus luteus]